MNSEKIIDHALKMMQIEFEQRSNQVIQMALDRSRLFRLGLIVWGIPLVVTATLFKAGLNVSIFNWELSAKVVISLSFYIASLINCVLLAAIISNGNSSNLSASGINYLRSIYFKILSDNGIIHLNDELRQKVLCYDNGEPQFRVISSESSGLSSKLIAITNIIYSIIGSLFLATIEVQYIFFTIPSLILIIFINYYILKAMDFKGIS